MVLGLRSKSKRFTSVQVEYIIEVLEIKPWPASQSLRSIHSVVLQWENGNRNFGLTNPIIPSLAEGKIEFNESFRLQVTLTKESSGRTNDSGSFHKNILQLHLHEPKKDKTVKGQQLGTAVLDLAKHGIIKDSLRVGVPMNFKRSFRSIPQPVLYVKMQSVENKRPESSSRDGLSKNISLDRDGKGSVSTLMSEEYAEEDEIASFTDDDVSSHSSPTNSSSFVENSGDLLLQNNPEKQYQLENLSNAELKEDSEDGQVGCSFIAKPIHEKAEVKTAKSELIIHDATHKENDSSCQSSTVGLSVNHESSENGDFELSKPDSVCLETLPDLSGNSTTCSSSLHHGGEVEDTFRSIINGNSKSDQLEVQTNLIGLLTKRVCKEPLKEEINVHEKTRNTSISNSQMGKLSHEQRVDGSVKSISDVKSQESSCSLDEVKRNHTKSKKDCKEDSVLEYGSKIVEEVQSYHSDSSSESFSSVMVAEVEQHEHMISGTSIYSGIVHSQKDNGSLSHDRRRSKSFMVNLPPHLLGSNVNANANQSLEDINEIGVLEDVSNSGVIPLSNKGAEEIIKKASRFNSSFSDTKVHELESRVKKLEGELREAAAIEIGFYSIVAEHGSSVHKVHTPARRLSRLYLHASKLLSRERRAGAARSAVSGLVMVAKACGSDLPRLTFWLSNSIVLRAIVSHARQSEKSKFCVHFITEKGSEARRKGKKFPLKWESIPQERFSLNKGLDDWEDPQTFLTALEKIEAWIFSRIVESVWWQSFTPYMQSSKVGDESKSFSKWKKRFERESSLDEKMRKNYSFEIWKKAFQDAYGRLCPVRGDGHECGCLSIMAILVMEQCVARLDVAMFNALLRESDDETPTDPIADPIINRKVLPVPPGKLSFGVGAQLKNAIGNWSRSLTSLFGMDVDDSSLDENNEHDEKVNVIASLKSFHLLNALSDLLMLPKDLLVEEKFRKKVCPTFSSSVIRIILSSFFPDEFCPDEVPASVFEALDYEDQMVSSEDVMVRNIPCSAFQISYSPPSAASIQNIIGDVQSTSQLKRSRSAVVRKCHASDDELEELDSRLSAFVEGFSSPSVEAKEKSSGNPLRYQLLRDVWKFDD